MKIGTIGTGSIVSWVMTEALRADGMEWGAVCSRREETGRALADRFGVAKVYTDLDAMLADEALDFIYVASPNSLHYAQTRRALLAGKNVICEKPFAPTRAQAEELAALAQEKGLFLFEGITTMYLPHLALIREKLAEIGPVRQAACTFCQYSSKYDALCAGETPNVFNPAFAGGALMDINLYNLYFAYGLFGVPEKLSYHAHKYANGIDTSGVLVLEYPDFVCQCTGAKDCQGDNCIRRSKRAAKPRMMVHRHRVNGAAVPDVWCTAAVGMVHTAAARFHYSGIPLRLRMDSPSIWMV